MGCFSVAQHRFFFFFFFLSASPASTLLEHIDRFRWLWGVLKTKLGERK